MNFVVVILFPTRSDYLSQKLAPFSRYVDETKILVQDTILVGAASAPCTLQFKFENNHSTLLEKVIVSYNIKVTSPSRELLLEIRRLRTESCLKAIGKGMQRMSSESKPSDLKDEIMKLKDDIEKRNKEIDLLMDEERRWNALITNINSSVP